MSSLTYQNCPSRRRKSSTDGGFAETAWRYYRVNLVDVANDALIGQQSLYIGLGKSGNSVNVKVAERRFYGWPFFSPTLQLRPVWKITRQRFSKYALSLWGGFRGTTTPDALFAAEKS